MADQTAEMEEYYVSDACIACDACCDDFPDIFKMDADHTRAEAYAPTPKGTFNPWDIVTVCPVDAISLIKGEMPPPPEDLEVAEEEAPIELEDDRPWEIRWAEVKDLPENEWERMKRYGLAYTIDETVTEYHVKFAMPEEVPNHPFKFKWGLPNKMPDYAIEVSLENNILRVKAILENARVKKLCNVANSFPDRFLRNFEMPFPCESVSHKYDPTNKVLEVVVKKANANEVAA